MCYNTSLGDLMKFRKFKEDSKMQKKFIQSLLQVEDIRNIFECFSHNYNYLKRFEKTNHYYHNYYVKEENDYIGWISYGFSSNTKEAELLYCLLPEYRGWGHIDRMIEKMERLLYEQGVQKTILEIPRDHEASLRVAMRMQYEIASNEGSYLVCQKDLVKKFGEKHLQKKRKTIVEN